jgi:hypothetical protein
VTQFRQKGTIEAVKWNGDNIAEVKNFLGDCFISANEEYVTYKKKPYAFEAQVSERPAYFVANAFNGSEPIKYHIEAYEFERQWEPDVS